MSKAIELYNNATFTVVTDDQNPGRSEIWATQKEMAKAFGVGTQNITMHIKGTKHTKDECVLLDMYNAGHIGIIPTII